LPSEISDEEIRALAAEISAEYISCSSATGDAVDGVALRVTELGYLYFKAQEAKDNT